LHSLTAAGRRAAVAVLLLALLLAGCGGSGKGRPDVSAPALSTPATVETVEGDKGPFGPTEPRRVAREWAEMLRRDPAAALEDVAPCLGVVWIKEELLELATARGVQRVEIDYLDEERRQERAAAIAVAGVYAEKDKTLDPNYNQVYRITVTFGDGSAKKYLISANRLDGGDWRVAEIAKG